MYVICLLRSSVKDEIKAATRKGYGMSGGMTLSVLQLALRRDR